MSVNVIDVEESDIEGLVASVVIIATLGLETVYFCAVFTNDYSGVGGGQENDWKKEGGELHGEPTKAAEEESQR